MERLKLPNDISIKLTDYAEAVLDQPHNFILPNRNIVKIQGNKHDAKIPGISNSFFDFHDHRKETWENLTLTVNVSSHLKNIAYPDINIMEEIISWISNETKLIFIRPSGIFLYPKNGFMGWHTNSNAPFYRIYLAYNRERKQSVFKYLSFNNGISSVIEDFDEAGWTVRLFKITNKPDKLFWHCVDVFDSPRISLGFRFQ